MNEEIVKALASELAESLNERIDIPFVNEEDEHRFFELVILIVLRLILQRIGIDARIK